MATKKNKPKKEPQELPSIVNRVPGFSFQFKEDLGWWFKSNRKKAAKILDMVTAVMEKPFEGVGKPEPLKYLGSNIWSRRIDLEHRFIYQIHQDRIDFLACRFHYE